MTLVAVRRYAAFNIDALTGALQRQANAVADAWQLAGELTAAPYSGRKPSGAWRIQFYRSLPPGMGGVHLDTARGLPYAKVLADGDWSVAASHEFCEMLVDPEGTRFVTSGKREVLVEVCDPVEAVDGPVIDGIRLSRFVTPGYYTADPIDSITEGGYISWIEDGLWKQAFRRNGQLEVVTLGTAKLRTRREKDKLAAAHV